MNIIADVAGRYDELMVLLAKMPKDELIVLLGDIVDRGPKSMEVVTWAMGTPNVITLKGNHEDMMLDAYNRFDMPTWENNGGKTTLISYGGEYADIPASHIEWMRKLPLFHKEDGIFISHAPWLSSIELGKIWVNESRMVWNRFPPRNYPGILQVFGHNTCMTKYEDDEDNLYAICIDDSGMDKLTGLHWPSKTIYQVDYIK